MSRIKANEPVAKKSKKAVVLSILFTLFIPIGFVYIMGFLTESIPMLYYYTKHIFVIFIVLLVIGLALLGYHIYQYMKVDTKKTKLRLKKFGKHKRQYPIREQINEGY